MADLVSTSQALAFLGLGPDEDDGSLLRLIDDVEAFFEQECNRSDLPFQAAQTARTDRLDGTGRTTLYLPYAVASLTSVKLGYDVNNPDETLAVNDQTKLVWTVGSSRLTRVDGGGFGWVTQPGYVTVVYNTKADLPAGAGLAILHGIAVLYRQRGSEDVKSEGVGGTRSDLAAVFEGDPVWERAVRAHRVWNP